MISLACSLAAVTDKIFGCRAAEWSIEQARKVEVDSMTSEDARWVQRLTSHPLTQSAHAVRMHSMRMHSTHRSCIETLDPNARHSFTREHKYDGAGTQGPPHGAAARRHAVGMITRGVYGDAAGRHLVRRVCVYAGLEK